MTKILVIAMISFKRVFRDPTALFFMLLLPVLITLIIGVSIFKAGSKISVGLVNGSTGPLSAELENELRSTDTFNITSFDSIQAMRKAIQRDQQTAGVTIPANYDRALKEGGIVKVGFIINPARNAPAAVRATLSAAVAEQAKLVQAARFDAGGRDFETRLVTARQLEESETDALAITSTSIGQESEPFPDGYGYPASANLVLTLFITALASAGILIETRRLGITRRVLGTPTSARTILLGETLGRFTITIVQALIVLVAGIFLFDVNFGDPFAAAALLLLFSLVATGTAMLVGTIFRTADQAGSIGPPIGIAFGML
ncbi:MAG: ABC transporter permease, partial [Actinomycetota bacterium]